MFVQDYLKRYSKEPSPKVVFRDDSLGDTKGYGSVNCKGITFTRVTYVNGLKHNLISISQLCDANFKVLFTKTQGTIFNQNDEVVLIAPRRRDAYIIDMSSFNKESNACFLAKASLRVNWLWHKRLSHLNFKNINNLAKHNLVSGLPSLTFSKDKNCSACEKGKHHRASFKTKRSFSINKSLHLFHMDLFVHVKPQTISHNKYTLVIVNEYSRNHKLEEFYDEKGISQNFSSPCSLEQNGGKAVNTACYTQNISIIVKRHGKTAYDVLSGRSPDISYFHVFGCHVHIHNHMDHLGKFDEKADDGFFLGYSPVAKAFRVFNIRRQEMEETVHVTFSKDDEVISQTSTEGDVINFNEIVVLLTLQNFITSEEPPEFTAADDLTAIHEPDHAESTDILESAEPQDNVLNGQERNTLNLSTSLVNRWLVSQPKAESEIQMLPQHMSVYMLTFSLKPKKFIEALEEEGWVLAMTEELNQFERNKVWTLVPKPYGKTIIGLKWVFRIKMDEEGVITKNKARLVAKGLNKDMYGLKQVPRAWYQANPNESHLVAVKRIFKYLKGTPNLGLWYPKGSSFDLKSYSDSDYARCNLDRKSTFGGAIAISNNPLLHSRTKHIGIRYHFIRDHILKGDIELHFVPNELQLADMFTKPLAEPSFTRLVAELESNIAYNNAVALLEHHEPLFQPMLSFLSNCSIHTALTKEPSTMYVEYLKEFWYTAEVDDATKDISFSLSLFKNQLSFTRFDFLTAIGLTDSKTVVPLPPKETVKAAASFQTPLTSEVSLTSHMLKVAKLLKEPDESLILPSEEVSAEATANKSQSGTNVQPLSQPKELTTKKSKKKKIPPSSQPKVSKDSREMNPPSTTTHLQATEEFVVTVVPLQSLEASVTAEVQDNQPKAADTTEVPKKIIEKEEDQTLDDYEESAGIQEDFDSDLQSMPDDDLRSDNIASAECLSIPNHLDHNSEEVSSLQSRLGDMEFSIVQTVSDEIKLSLPVLVTNALQEQLPGILSATLKESFPSIIKKSLQTYNSAVSEQFAATQAQLNRQFNISHVAQSNRFVTLQKELSKVVKFEVAKKGSVVRLEGVRQDLQTQTKHVSKLSSYLQDMQTQLQDVKDLLELAIIIDETAKGEKNKKDKDANTAAT
ncbi:retrovirus-related pol polyprotein from transposon TNT 1-94 [Tanacetum coccineum]